MEQRKTIILGIDPSLRGTGLGIIEAHGRNIQYVHAVTLHIRPKVRFAEALLTISDKIIEMVNRYNVQEASIEQPPYVKSVSVLRTLGAVYGACVTALEDQGIPCYEFTPLAIKQSATGYGKSEKDSVQKYIKWILSLETLPGSDEADALAGALTLANNYNQLIPAKLKRL